MRERGFGGWTWIDHETGEARLMCSDGKNRLARIEPSGRAVVCVYGRFQSGKLAGGSGEFRFVRSEHPDGGGQ
jgi:hypothetical protein